MTRTVFLASVALVASWGAMAQAEDLPKRRAGLWTSTIKSEAAGSQQTIKQCIDDKTDSLAKGAVTGGACKQTRLEKTATGYEIDASCTMGQISSTAKSLISGDFNTKITAHVTSTMVMAPGQQPRTTVTVIEAAYVGPCAADQRPGDIIMPDGKVVRTPGTQ